jgi:hypothetical protein
MAPHVNFVGVLLPETLAMKWNVLVMEPAMRRLECVNVKVVSTVLTAVSRRVLSTMAGPAISMASV